MHETTPDNDPMKYATLRDLKQALDSGDLVLDEEDAVIIDNDSTTLYIADPDNPDDSIEVFDGGTPGELLTQALELLGIPWGNA